MSIKQVLTEYRDKKIKIDVELLALKELKKQIEAHILTTGQGVEAAGIKASIRAGYTRAAWDNKGLRGYAVAHPEINTFLKESQVKASVVIKVNYGR